ncbi:MAG: SCO family protein [bacterium]|nr:SCO family protein [bacterium]
MKRLLAVIIVLGLIAAACSSEPEELAGFVRSPLPSVLEASLRDATAGGADFEMRAAENDLLLVYFGYTACPDVCPTTLADVRSALRELGDDADRVQLAMATIDPDRDTDEIITGYVQSFVPSAHGLRAGDAESLRAAADVFGADYGVTTTEEGDYEVIHTAHLYAVDDKGLLQVTWAFGTEPENIAADIRILLRSE